MTEMYGDKRTSLLAAGKVSHKVAVIGTAVFDGMTADQIGLDNADLEFFTEQQLGDLEELHNYTLVVTDFEGVVGNQEYFSKRMFEALTMGTNFCFVHYQHQALHGRPFALEDPAVNALYKSQVGLQAIFERQVMTYRANAAFQTGKIHANEFKSFLEKFGASYNYFHSEKGFDTEIYTTGENNLVLGFSVDSGRGKIIVLPFMRDTSRPASMKQGLMMLLDSLLTFITDSLVEMPNWAIATPFFEEETPLFDTRTRLEKELEETEEGLSTFKEAKSLLLQRKYTLENSVPRFLTENMGILIEREERYKEDFWITDADGQKVAIAEVKSLMKGLRESTIYSVLTHRDEYDYDETFPALLFVNYNLQAGSWSDKDQILDINDCEFAAKRNVLIVRIEDLLRLWNGLRRGKLTPSDVQKLMLTNRGWLKVTSSTQVEIIPPPRVVAVGGD